MLQVNETIRPEEYSRAAQFTLVKVLQAARATDEDLIQHSIHFIGKVNFSAAVNGELVAQVRSTVPGVMVEIVAALQDFLSFSGRTVVIRGDNTGHYNLYFTARHV